MSDEFERDLEEALTRYSQEMHDYTLQLWTDSRRAVEEQNAVKTVGRKKKAATGRQGGARNTAEEGAQSSSSTSPASPKPTQRDPPTR